MASKPLVVVCGATGAQGGSVVDALLKVGKYAIRGLTRDVSSQKSKALAAKGVEVVPGDVNDEQALKKAFAGAWAVFAVTAFWDPSVMGKELDLGKRLADIAKAAKVEFFVWSSLADVQRIAKGKYHVPHFTDKAQIEQYAKQIGLKVISVGPAFYFQNFLSFFPPKLDADGKTFVFTVALPETAYLTAYDVEDTGAAVAAVLQDPAKWINKFIPLWGTHAHPQEYVEAFSRISGKPARYNALSAEALANAGFPGAKELADMLSWFAEFTYFGPEIDLSLTKQLPPLRTWEEYLKAHGAKELVDKATSQ